MRVGVPRRPGMEPGARRTVGDDLLRIAWHRILFPYPRRRRLEDTSTVGLSRNSRQKMSVAAALERLHSRRRRPMTMSPLPICPDRAGGSDRPEPTRRGSVERARKPAAPDGPGERDCSGAQRLPAGAGEQGGGLRPRRTGYVKVRDSANGFTAIVQHSLATTQEPQCMDVEGTHTAPAHTEDGRAARSGKEP